MPWITDGLGEKKYVVSIYDKDCLPTWDELYNHFYKKHIFNYDPMKDDHESPLDPYLKRPRRKMILAFACNQLNKMIFEDGIDALSYFKSNPELSNLGFKKVIFTLGGDAFFGACEYEHYIGMAGAPSIYRCRIPSTGEYSIFANNKHPFIDIDDLDTAIRIYAVATTDIGVSVADDTQVVELIKLVLRPIIDYFENGIGWKDSNGILLPSDGCGRKCEGAGFDPAL